MSLHAIFESTNLRSTHFADRIFDAVADEDLDNGTFGYLTDLEEDGGVIYKFVKGFKSGEPICVVDQPAWTEATYNTGHTKDMRRDNFYVEAGIPFRVRVLGHKLDEFAITLPGITADTQSVVTGATDFSVSDVYLTIDASTGKLKASTTSTVGAEFEGKIMRKRLLGGTLSTPLRNYGYSYVIYEVKITTLN